MITSWIKIRQDANQGDSRKVATYIPDAAQAQEAVVFSLRFSGYEAVRTKLGSTEASSGLDARLLLDRSSSSISEDMSGEVQLSWRRVGTCGQQQIHILVTPKWSHDMKRIQM